MAPNLSQLWSEAVDQNLPASTTEDWNDDWPESWLGTQIVIFEFDGEEVAVGGLMGHDSVYTLTKAAAEERGYSFTVEETSIGIYISSINGVQGDGWEYFVDGSKGRVSVDNVEIESTSIVRWTPV